MRSSLTLAFFLLLTAPLLQAQETDNDLDNDFRGRLSVEVDKKISKGFHVFAEGQLRATDNYGVVGRYQATAGVSYKLAPWLKAAVSYVFMERINSDNSYSPRHRTSLDLTATGKEGLWKFSVKERLQLTNRPGTMNEYQNVRNALHLKSRIKAEYSLTGDIAPYVYAEIKNTLNAPLIKAEYDAASAGYLTPDGLETGDAGWFMDGYRDIYVCRYRLSAGMEYKIDRQHLLDFFLLSDYCREKNIDANKSGTRLKSVTIDRALHLTAGVAYTYSF